ncbi:MAG: GDSL-type esterase/lipase family protein [Actinomycetales bacterium]
MSDDLLPAGLRICVLGDALVAGIGDNKGLGWTGRVAARTTPGPGGLAMFPLGIPGDGTPQLLARCRNEAWLRYDRAADNRLVLAPGTGDLDQGVSLARSRLNLANLLDDARADEVSCLVVGPPPTTDRQGNERVGDLSAAYADVCERRDIGFVDCHTPLVGHEQWYADLASGDGRHPGQVGYGLVAWLVLHNGWHAWLGLPGAQ